MSDDDYNSVPFKPAKRVWFIVETEPDWPSYAERLENGDCDE